ncbi:MAG: CHASE domain-containing protein [Myxococcota bacterium]|nr:CHASE domain-containing protein [Myxococcota bacterium]
MRRRSISTFSRAPLGIALACAMLTALASLSAWSWLRAREEAALERSTADVVALVERRMAVYLAMLRGGAGLFAASDHVGAHEFRRFVGRQQLQEYPGIQGVGWSERRSEEGAPPARDRPRAEQHAIVYLEPLDTRNRAALGFDMSSDPVRREAMERARDTGMRAMSGRVTLVQEIDEPVQPGFLVYVPVYEGDDVPRTVEERRARLRGFVYAPFRAIDLFDAILSPAPRYGRVEVFDGADAAEEARLYGEPSSDLSAGAIRQVEIAGRTWTIRMCPTQSDLPVPFAVGGGLALFGMILTALVYRAARAESVARARAEQASQAKDELLAAVSHELRTPLQSILGWVAIARELGVPAGMARPIAAIERSGWALARRVEDLIDTSRAATGKLAIEPGTVALAELVRSAVEAAAPVAREKDIALDTEIVLDGLIVPGDSARLRQAIDNVLQNAMKFTAAGGHVRVRAHATRQRAWIEVHDDGAGIPPEHLPRIFDRFQQVDTSTTGRGSGLGLGLALADEIVALHGGTIRAASEGLGRGATFTIELPRA